MTSDQQTIVYTDGACSGNPGPGGWAWVEPDGESAFGGELDTTNQRMELRAVLEAVRAIEGPLHVVSDSTYVVNCFRDSWWKGWLKRDWKNSQKKPVANRDLWEPLIQLYRERGDVTFEWVKGHSGDRWNDRADELAVQGRDLANPRVATDDEPDGETATGLDGTEAARSLAVVGHRPPDIGGYGPNPTATALRERLRDIFEAKRLMFDEVRVLTGLQLGTEQLAAEAALAAGVPFVAVLAFPDPSARWPKESQQRFDELIDAASDVVILDASVPASSAHMAKSFARRDKWLQREADEAVVVWNGQDRAIGAQLRAFEAALGDDVWILDV